MATDVFYSAALRRVMHIAYVWPCCMPLAAVNGKKKKRVLFKLHNHPKQLNKVNLLKIKKLRFYS